MSDYNNLLHNIRNTKRQLKLAQRKLLVLEMQEKLMRIKSYVNRAENSILNGDFTYVASVNRLLDAVAGKMARADLPPIPMDAVDDLLVVQASDSSVVTTEIEEASASVDEAQHQTANYITMKIVEASEGKNDILASHNIARLEDIQFLDEDLCNQLIVEAQEYVIDAGRKSEIEDMLALADPLFESGETRF